MVTHRLERRKPGRAWSLVVASAQHHHVLTEIVTIKLWSVALDNSVYGEYRIVPEVEFHSAAWDGDRWQPGDPLGRAFLTPTEPSESMCLNTLFVCTPSSAGVILGPPGA